MNLRGSFRAASRPASVSGCSVSSALCGRGALLLAAPPVRGSGAYSPRDRSARVGGRCRTASRTHCQPARCRQSNSVPVCVIKVVGVSQVWRSGGVRGGGAVARQSPVAVRSSPQCRGVRTADEDMCHRSNVTEDVSPCVWKQVGVVLTQARQSRPRSARWWRQRRPRSPQPSPTRSQTAGRPSPALPFRPAHDQHTQVSILVHPDI